MVYCKICSKTTIADNELCPSCQKKRKASKIVLHLQNKINFKDSISNVLLYNLGYKDDIRRYDAIYVLQETNLISKVGSDDYEWIDIEKLTMFVQKYDEDKGINFKIATNIEKQKGNICKRCGNEIKGTNKKQKYCKLCKKINKTLKNIKFISQFDSPINTDRLIQETSKEDYQIEGIIYDLVENDLIKDMGGNDFQLIEENIDNYLNKHQKEPDNDKEITKNEKVNPVGEVSKSEEIEVQDNITYDSTIKTETNEDTIHDKKTHEPIGLRKVNAKLSRLQPAGFILYKKITDNTIDIEEYNLQSHAINNRKEGYTLSKVYILRDFTNVKFIEKISAYYIYSKNQNEYKNTTLYTFNDLKSLIDYRKNKHSLEKQNKSGEVINVNQDNEENQHDNTEKQPIANQDEIHDKHKGIKIISLTNEEILDEFFDKFIKISHDETKWITYEQIYKTLVDYSLNSYNKRIPEAGPEGFNTLFYSKIKKIMGLKSLTENGQNKYNLIYEPEDKGNIDEKDPKYDSTDLKLKFKRFEKYFKENLEITSNTYTTQSEIYEDFKNYYKDLYDEKIEFVDYVILIQRTVKQEDNIYSRVENTAVYYNLKVKEKTKLDDKNTIVDTVITKDEKPKTIKVSTKTSNQDIIKHIRTYLNNNLTIVDKKPTRNDLTQKDIYIKFNEYYIKHFDESIKYSTFIYNFQKIIRDNLKIRKTVYKKKVHYNLEFINKNSSDAVAVDDKFNIKNNQQIFDEFFEKHIQIDDDEKNWINNEELYELFSSYAYKQYNVKIQEFGFEGFNFLLSRKKESMPGIKNKSANSQIQYNLIYLKKAQKTFKLIKEEPLKENNVVLNSNKTLSKEVTINLEYDNFDELTDKSEISSRLSYYLDNNMRVLDRKATKDDITSKEIYSKFKEYLEDQYSETLTFMEFRKSFEELIISYNINSRMGNGKIYYNLELITESPFQVNLNNNIQNEVNKLAHIIKGINKDNPKILDYKIPQQKLQDENAYIKILPNTNKTNIISYKKIIDKSKLMDVLILILEYNEKITKVMITTVPIRYFDVNLEFVVLKEKQNELIQKIKHI